MNIVKNRLMKLASIEEVEKYMSDNGYIKEGQHYKQEFNGLVATPYVSEVTEALKTNDVKFVMQVDIQNASDPNEEIDDLNKSVIMHVAHLIDARVNKIYSSMAIEDTYNNIKDAVEDINKIIKGNIDIDYAKEEIIKYMKQKKMLKEETINNCEGDKFYAFID